jgi:UDP-N-acetylmuramate--alanine ligase
MADKGHIIAGSDRSFDINPDHPLKRLFQSRGIIITPQDGSGINEALDLVVCSTAVEPQQPEILKAKAKGIPVKTRPEYLYEISESFRTIAVSGTSGKSTVSGLLAFLMKRLGLSPNFIGGGKVRQFKTSTNPGNSLTGNSDYLIIEACESDESITQYRPEYSIILNLSLDHHPVEKTAGMFESLMKNTKKKVIINIDDENLRNITGKDAITFSINAPSDYRAYEIIQRPFSTEFSVSGIRFSLPFPGEHNVYNALSCIALLSEIGISLNEIAGVLPEFKGIERRFDILINKGKRLVIDDYAHNPHKISSLMKTVSRLSKRVCYIFQPHGFGPTRLMKDKYIKVFNKHLRDTDCLILLPIFYAGGTVCKDISSHDLAEGIRADGKNVEVVQDRGEVLKKSQAFQTCVVFGARDDSLSELARQIAGVSN